MSTRLTDFEENVAPPAVLPFSDQTFFYTIDEDDEIDVPVPDGAGFVSITATQFVGVVNGASIAIPSDASGTAGYQEVNFASTITSGTATGLANTSQVYTATVTVDGVNIAIQITGSNAQTYGALVNQLNTDLSTAATAAISGGKLRITSATTGTSSTVRISNAQIITPTPSPTPSITQTPSVTPTITLTASNTPTISTTPSNTRTPSVTPSVTDSPGLSPTPSASATVTLTPTPTVTKTATPTITATISVTPSITRTITVTPSVTGTITITPTTSPTITVSPSPYASGLFNSLTLFTSFALPVDGTITPNNMEVVLTIVKLIAPNQTVVGVTGFTDDTRISLSFYAP